jgi:hypothetical protein
MNNPSVFELIERLSQNLPLDPARVAEILGARLERDPGGDSPVLTSYALPPGFKDSRYQAVELRIPHPLFGTGGGLLNVVLQSDEGLATEAIFQRFGLDFQRDVPSPRYPPGLPVYYNYELPWGTLSVGTTNDDASKLVSFIIKPKQAA